MFLLLACAAPARADLPSRISIRADAIGFYADHLLVAAEGHVRAQLGARTIQSDSLRYDLAHNTLLACGNVRVAAARTEIQGAAYVLDAARGEAKLLRLAPLPATFTLPADESAPVEEPAPPDAFQTIDLSGEQPYIASAHAAIVPNASIRLTPARFPVNARLSVPSPSYLYVFAPNPAFGITAPTLPPASFDQPYDLIGTTHSLLSTHLRYSTIGGISTGIDEHLVDGIQRYLIGSYVLRDRHFDLAGFQQVTGHLTQNFSGSLAADEKSARYVVQHTSRLFTTTLTLSQFSANVPAPATSPSSALATNGVSTASDDLQVSTAVRPIGHLLSYKLRSDLGYDNVSGQLPYNADFRTTLGASLYTPSLHGPFKSQISGEYDWASTHYDYPHQLATSSTLLTISRRASSAVSLYGSISFAQVYNRYDLRAFPNAGQQFLGLPNPAFPYDAPDGTPYPGYFAYDGLSTLRTYFLTATIAPNPNFNLLLSLAVARDFPQFHGLGRPPLTASFDLRIRPIRNIALELGRSYLFGWDYQRFTQYTLGISP